MNLPSNPDTHLRGPMRVVVRATWLVVVGLILATFAAGVPVRLSYLLSLVGDEGPALNASLTPVLEVDVSRLGPEEADALQSFGLSLRFYAGYILTFEVALALACAVIGLFVFWRRSDDWMALWVSLTLILLGTNSVSHVVPSLVAAWPGGFVLYVIAVTLGMVSHVHVLCLSPDGRFVPRWTLTMAAGSTGGILAAGLCTFLQNRGTPSFLFILLATPFWLAGIGLGVFAQIYRYARVSGPVQRQQTKWVVVGLVAMTLGFVVNAIFLVASGLQPGLPRLLFYLARAPAVTFCMVLLPVCLAFSIFRYRLWDIDIIIRRALIYGTFTAALALVYFGSVVVLQSSFRAATGQEQSQFVTALSTLALATLFFPLRQRVQAIIDRRLYRKKYDAVKTLADFAATVRDETDLEKLEARLVGVVEEAMQPESVSLWLRPSKTADGRGRPHDR